MEIFQNIRNFFIKPEINASVISGEDKYRIVYDQEKTGHIIPVEKFHVGMTDMDIKAFPLVNEMMAGYSDSGVFATPFGISPAVDYNILWTYFKYTPEIVAVVRAIVEDIMSDGWTLEADTKLAKKRAEKFLMENFAKEQIISMLYDTMVTGDGLLYVQRFSKLEVKGRIDNILGRLEMKGDELKHELGTRIFESLEQDEDIFTPRSFIHIPSSTMKAEFDKNGNVHKWIQKVGVRFQTFSSEEIIHFRLLRLDGKFYGYSPMVSILKEMDILANVKDFARYFFEKGGTPNFMFIMENETPNSENYKNFKKSLQLYSSLANKYKNIAVCGKVEAVALNKLTRDMEFRELAKYLTQILVMTWGVPTSRLSDVGLGDRSTRTSTISTEGYYRKISHIQDMLEDLINVSLLKSFKVTMKFKKTYQQQVQRDAQIDKVKTDTAEQRMGCGIWTREMAAEYCGVEEDELPTEEEWQKMKELMPAKQGWGTGKQGVDKINEHQILSDSPEKLGQNVDKQSAALDGIKENVENLENKIDDLEEKLDEKADR